MAQLRSENNQGFITMVSVLFIGLIGLSIALGLFYSSIQTSKQALILDQSLQARSLANACIEKALEGIREDPAYLGESFGIGNANCDVAINQTGDDYVLNATGYSGPDIRKVSVNAHLDELVGTMQIVSWQEVADF